MLIAADHVKKRINEKIILADEQFSIEPEEKIGLIGINGTGKTTCLKILLKMEPIDSGTILYKNGIRIHYLPQNPVFTKDSIWDEITYVNSLNKIPCEEFECKSVLTKLGLLDHSLSISHLSGGQQKRLALACALLTKCDLLLLDEPTNHLDHTMIDWLEKYIKRLHCAVLLVTHDRYFLDSLCDKIFELDQGHIYTHEGNFETYLENKAKRIELEQKNRQKLENLYKHELAWVRAGVQARSTKSKDRLQRFEQLRERRKTTKTETLTLSSAMMRLGKQIIEADNVSFAYGDKQIFSDFTYHFLPKDRIGILGHNGCGKTTLMKVLSKRMEPTQGHVIHGSTVKIGYFAQGDDNIDTSMRVIDYLEEYAKTMSVDGQLMTAAQMLERFMFDRSMHYLPIDRLSGGQRRRLYLCRVLLENPNVLFLDEPTNDLDLLTLEILEDYLDSFAGAVIVVSHDRYFLDRVVDHVFAYENGHFVNYVGGYSDYLVKHVDDKPKKVSNDTRVKTSRVKLSYMEKRELEQLTVRMDELQNMLDKFAKCFETVSDFNEIRELTDKQKAAEEELEVCTLRWMELEEKNEG